MEDKISQLIGYDYRGPASSKVLNDFVEDINTDLGTLLANTYQLKTDTALLANQTYKQSMAFAKRLNSLATRDDGSTCKANLGDSTVLLTTDLDDATIATDSRLVHMQDYGVILPPTARNNWLSYSDSTRKYVADGVETAVEPISESGIVYTIPETQAISGISSTFYERIVSSPSIVANQSVSVFFSVPETRTGIGYPASNFIQFMPFPLYTPDMKVWYTTDSEPTLSIAGSTWNDWSNYIDPLYHNNTYMTELGPTFTSFPNLNITALRFDIQQPFYLIDGTNYIYSYGIGNLELGMLKSTTATAVGTIRIDKPTGSFTSITSVNVTLDNIPSADVTDVLSTRSEIDSGDASIAYVEITLTPGGISTGQIPIISEVSVDYT